MPFSTFIGYCKDLLQCKDDGPDSISQFRKHEQGGVDTQQADFALEEESPKQIYLAQVCFLTQLMVGMNDSSCYVSMTTCEEQLGIHYHYV